MVIHTATHTALHPFTFLISEGAGTCISTPDLAQRSATIISFTVVTADTLEPSTWILTIASLALAGIWIRVRRLRESA